MVAGHTVIMSTAFTATNVTPPRGSRPHSGHVDDLHSAGRDTSTW